MIILIINIYFPAVAGSCHPLASHGLARLAAVRLHVALDVRRTLTDVHLHRPCSASDARPFNAAEQRLGERLPCPLADSDCREVESHAAHLAPRLRQSRRRSPAGTTLQRTVEMMPMSVASVPGDCCCAPAAVAPDCPACSLSASCTAASMESAKPFRQVLLVALLSERERDRGACRARGSPHCSRRRR